MSKFTKIIAPALIAALGIGAAAVPASAQPYGQQHNGRHDAGRPTPVRNSNLRADINGLSRDIDRAVANRRISSREAIGLKRDAQQVQRLYAQYSRNGLTRSEVQTLQNRVDRIHVALRAERRDRDNRRG